MFNGDEEIQIEIAQDPVAQQVDEVRLNQIDSQNVGEARVDNPSCVHENTDWLSNITLDFKQQIISPCSEPTRNAFETNQSIFSPEKLEGDVRMEIKKSIVNKLNSVFCGNGRPKLAQVRKIVDELSHKYPALYREERGKKFKTGWKFGGKGGTEALAKQIMSALQSIDGRTQPRQKRSSNNSAEVEEAPKQKIYLIIFVI